MRLEGQQKLGFFPAPKEAIELIATKVKADPEAVIVDPCAGEGEAVQLLARLLGIDESRIVASELENGRSQKLRARLQRAIISECTDFQSAAFERNMASLLYLNPPFDGEVGRMNDRCELTFLARATQMLAPGGLLVMILPKGRIPDIRKFVHDNYEDANQYPFPEKVRRFVEVIAIARKRSRPLDRETPSWRTLDYEVENVRYVAGKGKPFEIQKRAYTQEELKKLLKVNPTQVLGVAIGRKKSVRPPLQLGAGHVALLLAAGHLNGKVQKEGEDPHVVRGTSRKVEVDKGTVVEEKETTTTTQEKIELVIRKVDHRGVIEDVSNA